MSDKYIITISRAFGSMGRSIAKEMSEILNIEFYDRDIVEKVSSEINVSVPEISDLEEKADMYRLRCFPLGKGTTELQDRIFLHQSAVIKELAEQESCIIVGRCADYVLREHTNCLNIYIYSSYKNRLKNSINNLGIDSKEAKKIIKATDRARKAYHLRYAKYEPDDLNHKHLLIDSSAFGVDGTAHVLAEIAKKRFDLN